MARTQGPLWGCTQGGRWGCIIWRPDQGWEIHFQSSSLTWLASWCGRWQEASLPPHGAVGLPSQHGALLPPEWASPEIKASATKSLMTSFFCNILLTTLGSILGPLIHSWRGLHKGGNTRRQASQRAILEASYHHSPFTHPTHKHWEQSSEQNRQNSLLSWSINSSGGKKGNRADQ